MDHLPILTPGTQDQVLKARRSITLLGLGGSNAHEDAIWMDGIHRALQGDMDASTRAAASRKAASASMDNITSAILVHHGIDVEYASALISLVDPIQPLNICRGNSVIATLDSGGSHRTRLSTTSKAAWLPSGRLLSNLDPIPQTLALGLKGKPLSRLLSHPALDPIDLRIDTIDADELGTVVRIRRRRAI